MNLVSFIAKNSLRNKRRAALSILSVAISLFLFVTLLVALREITQPPEDSGASLRIAVRSNISIAESLPARQLPTILKIPGIAAVTPMTYFGGKFRDDEGMRFAQFGIDPTKLISVFGEAKVPPEQMAAWLADRTSCLLGVEVAEHHKLKVGDRITLVGTIYPCDLELTIAGLYSGTIEDRNCWFHQKYLDEATGDRGEVGMWWIRAESAETAPQVITDIHRAFANTANEVRAETERAFQMSFVSMWGNIRMFVGAICTVVVFTLVLVSASTMSMAVRERFRELAILKALGFRRREITAFILAESCGLALLGAIVGAGGAWAAYTYGDLGKLTGGMFPRFEVTSRILGLAFGIAAALGILASLGPAIAAARMSVVEGLKTLD